MLDLPDWLVGDASSWLALLGVVLMVIGGIVGSVLTNRVAKRAAEASAITAQAALETAHDTAENSLVDQLQEELGRYREAADRRATAQDERMNRLESLVDGYRNYAHELRSHIYDRKAPPPPDWPAGLPR